MHKVKDILERLRKHSSDSIEKKKLFSWMKNNQDEAGVHTVLKEHWDKTSSEISNDQKKKLEALLIKIRATANIPGGEESGKLIRLRKLSSVKLAASIVLPVLVLLSVGLFKIMTTEKEGLLLVEECGTQTRYILLPDSTEVWLNSESKLSYFENINKLKQRCVTLTGQAYFKVHHDVEHPFIVETGDVKIKVLGTSFDVSAYSNDEHVYSTLKEGSIALLNKEGEEIEKLEPGEQAIYHKGNGELNISDEVEVDDFTAWIDGKLVVDDEGLEQVVRKLERRYDCEINLSQRIKEENPIFSFAIKNESLPEVCQLIEMVTDAEISINENTVTIN